MLIEVEIELGGTVFGLVQRRSGHTLYKAVTCRVVRVRCEL